MRTLFLASTAAALLPAPRIAADFDPRPVITGGSTANLLFGKLQRAAQLPTTRLAKNPCAAVDDQGKLESLLWSSFAMSSLPAADALKRSELSTSRALESGLLFLDALPAEAGGWQPFGGGKKAAKDGEAPQLDRSAIELAAARGAQHAFVLLKGDAAILECVALLESLPLCATLIAPEEGITVASTPGWVCEPLQDHDGSLLGPLAVAGTHRQVHCCHRLPLPPPVRVPVRRSRARTSRSSPCSARFGWHARPPRAVRRCACCASRAASEA